MVSPTLVPSNERIGSVASSERVVVNLERWDFGGLVNKEDDGVLFEKIEDDRKEIEDGGCMNVAIVILFFTLKILQAYPVMVCGWIGYLFGV